jgi:hypothetical protein
MVVTSVVQDEDAAQREGKRVPRRVLDRAARAVLGAAAHDVDA